MSLYAYHLIGHAVFSLVLVLSFAWVVRILLTKTGSKRS